MTNRKIIQAIKNRNDKLIFELLYKQYLPMIVHIVKSYNGSEDDAKDVFHDTLIVLIREVEHGRIDEEKSMKNFIYTVAKNLYINKLKKANRFTEYGSGADLHYADKAVKNHVESEQSEKLVLSIIEQLGDKCYQILKAIMFDNKRQEEIAVDLGLSDRRVVKTYKNRCKMKFIELLKGNPKLSLELIRNEDGFKKYISVN